LRKLETYEGVPAEELRRATRRAFENLVNLALEESVNFVLIAGDLYDGDWKDYKTGLYLLSQLRKLREAEIPVFIVAGNHDALSKITKDLALPKGITRFPTKKATTIILDDPPVAIHGRSFSTNIMKKNLAVTYPSPVPGYFNIGLLHTSLNGREGHETYAPCSLEDLINKGYDYWALGHAHRLETVHESHPFVAFPGNTQGRHIRETGPKGCLLVTVNEPYEIDAEFRNLDVVRWERINVDVSGAEDPYEVLELVGNQIKETAEKNDNMPLIVRLEISGSSPAHEALSEDVDRWTNEIRSIAGDITRGNTCIEKVVFRTSYPKRARDISFKEGPIGELITYLDNLESSPELLLDLGSLINDLMKKLPPELKQGEDSPNPGDPQWMAEIVRQVRPMLIRKLLEKRSPK